MVKWTGKLAVFVMVMSVWALPLMACMMPDALLTDEERECCKNMADDCGQIEMPASHSCCKAVAQQIDSYLINSRFPVTHPGAAVALFGAVEENPLPVSVTLAGFSFREHSPPASPPDTISILRI